MSSPTGVRLLYVGGFDFPSAHARVIQSLHTAAALARAGWTVRLLVQRPAGRRYRAPLASELARYGVEPHDRLRITPVPVLRPRAVRGVDVHLRLAVTNWSYGLGALWRAGRQSDLILARDPRLAWLFLKARPLHGARVIYEVHELFSTRPRDNVSLDTSRQRGVSDRTRSLERFVMRRADLLLPLTRACADLIQTGYGVPSGRIAVVPDGAAPPLRDPRPIDWEASRVVYTGQLYPWKGVDVLLRALGKLPGVQLDVAGGFGPRDPYLAEARRLAAELGLAERARFLGYVPHSRVRSVMGGAFAGAAPLPDRLMSRYFTSPLKVFDYMAAGVPVVASDLPALREVLADRENAVLVPPDDPAALAEALAGLQLDRALAERIRARALQDVAAFSWDCRAERIIRAATPLLG